MKLDPGKLLTWRCGVGKVIISVNLFPGELQYNSTHKSSKNFSESSYNHLKILSIISFKFWENFQHCLKI